MNLSSFSWIHYDFFIFLANCLWIQYFSANLLWIHYPFLEFTIIHYLFRLFTMNSIGVSRIYLFHEFTIDSLSFLRIHYLFHEYVINVFPVFTNKRELLRCHHILVRLYLFRALATFFDQIVCKVYYMLYSDKMSFSKFCYYYSWLIRQSRSDSYGMSHELWVIYYRYFIFSKFFLNPRTRFGRNF